MYWTKNPYSVKAKFSERLRSARKKCELRQQDAVDKISSSPLAPRGEGSDEPQFIQLETYKKWEYGVNQINIEWIPAICDTYNCDVGYLFGEYEEMKRTFSDVCTVTGLSEESIIQLDRMYHDKHFPDGVGLGVSAKGYTLGHVSILDEIIKSGSLIWLLNELSQYLIYGGILPKDAYTNDEHDLTLDEHERFFKWANKRGLEIKSREDISEMHLQTACDVLKNMFRDILKKELEKRG